MKFGTRLLVVGVALLILGSAPVRAQQDGTSLSVLTQNEYFGGDLVAVAQATDLPSFLAAAKAVLTEMAANNFPARAEALAREISDRRPHIVGLQEVANLKLNGVNTGAPPFVDQLALTLAALDALGAAYVAVAQVQNTAVIVPVDFDGNGTLEMVSFTDRDVILARRDLVDAGLVSAVPLSSMCARPSVDGGPGCNYQAYAQANSPVGPLPLERGFVAVDVTLGVRTFRVVNTHLEIENLTADPMAPYYQSAQAAELKALIDAVSGGTSVVIVGDMNSTPVDPLFPDPFTGPFVRPYQQFAQGVDLFGNNTAGGAYGDAWLLRPGQPTGGTCCEANLSLRDRSLLERKDLVFTRDLPLAVKANLVGNNPEDMTASGLWPSDHAGVWVRFRF